MPHSVSPGTVLRRYTTVIPLLDLIPPYMVRIKRCAAAGLIQFPLTRHDCNLNVKKRYDAAALHRCFLFVRY